MFSITINQIEFQTVGFILNEDRIKQNTVFSKQKIIKKSIVCISPNKQTVKKLRNSNLTPYICPYQVDSIFIQTQPTYTMFVT